MASENQFGRPKVGCAAIVRKNGKVLIGKRKGAHGSGTWQLPGGHMEFGETPEECAVRETEEEVGIKIGAVSRFGYTNDIFKDEKKHYITLFVLCDYLSGDVQIMEPDKCDCWEWVTWDEIKLHQPQFLPLQNLIEENRNPFE
eukprot:270310_1